jgi:iron complex outermembrane receptor protein
MHRSLHPVPMAAVLVVWLAAMGTAAQSPRMLPETLVTASRLGDGVTGASTTVITARDIERAPGETLQDVLSTVPGIQLQSVYGGVNGAGTTVDLRGFGAAATANTLVLVNGRRLNDLDLAGIDFGAIPRGSIERIEVTRGNGGAVLYGDGAVGGVINIVTRNPFNEKPMLRADTGLGSLRHREAAIAASRVLGDTALMLHASTIASDGYRANNALRQNGLVAELRRSLTAGEAYLTFGADTQDLGLPGPRRVTPTLNELASDRRGTYEPFNFADKRGVHLALGGTRRLAGDVEIILDGGLRRKQQTAAFFSDFGAAFNTHTDSVLTTLSATPRIIAGHRILGLSGKVVAGIDLSASIYGSDRRVDAGDAPAHRYDLTQRVLAAYAQETLALRTDTDLSFGLRLQQADTGARDRFDASAPSTGSPVAGARFDRDETNHAFHIGLEHRLDPDTALFARIGRSFRLPTVDERVGAAPYGVPVDFALRTQTSRDIEAGLRRRWGELALQLSAFAMTLRDELQFDPSSFTNVNLDPTRRRGVEAAGTYRVHERLRLSFALAHTEAEFAGGPFKGNDVPLVSRWTGHAGISWDVVDRLLVLDARLRRVGDRRLDNDQANFQPQIPGHTAVDLRLGGERPPLTWSFSAHNLLDARYFDYGVASATTYGRYNAYPLPGRTLIARIGVTF